MESDSLGRNMTKSEKLTLLDTADIILDLTVPRGSEREYRGSGNPALIWWAYMNTFC